MKSVRLILLGAIFTLTGAVAIGQPAEEMSPLSGPSVREGGVPGDAKSFGGGPGTRREGDRPLAHRMFLNALDVIRGEKAAEGVRLGKEQEKSLRELEQSFQRDVRGYFEKNRETIQKARESLGLKAEMGEGDDFRRGVGEIRGALQKKVPAKKAGEPADAAMMMSDEAEEEAREKAREQMQRVYNNAPKPGEVHTRQWAVLNEGQKELVTKEIDRLRGGEEEDRRNYLGRRDTLKQDMEDIVAGKKELNVNDPRLPPAMREKLAAMGPEQQREAVRKFLDERGRRRSDGLEKKKAPTMDEVPLPPADESATDEK